MGDTAKDRAQPRAYHAPNHEVLSNHDRRLVPASSSRHLIRATAGPSLYQTASSVAHRPDRPSSSFDQFCFRRIRTLPEDRLSPKGIHTARAGINQWVRASHRAGCFNRDRRISVLQPGAFGRAIRTRDSLTQRWDRHDSLSSFDRQKPVTAPTATAFLPRPSTRRAQNRQSPTASERGQFDAVCPSSEIRAETNFSLCLLPTLRESHSV